MEQSRDFYQELASNYDLRNSGKLVSTHLATVEQGPLYDVRFGYRDRAVRGCRLRRDALRRGGPRSGVTPRVAGSPPLTRSSSTSGPRRVF
ncbi:hypothetical protein FAGKG844_350048 [Frankia sp. AgKG'84/4]